VPAAAAAASATNSSYPGHTTRAIVWSAENPRSSASRAQSTSVDPCTPSTVFGMPMPIFTPHLRVDPHPAYRSRVP
jgi:hypothetical protein